MFFVLFLALIVLAMIGIASVFGSAVAGIGALILLPILFLKIAFFIMLFGFIGRRFAGRRGPWGWEEATWRGRSRSDRAEPSNTTDEQFEEWHRMAHAREEVDGWVADLDDTEPE